MGFLRFCLRHWILSGLAALVLLVLVRAYLVQVTDPYLMSTGLNGHFEPCSSWQEYVSKKREQLIQARTKAGEDTSDAVIDFVAPFEIRSPSPVVGSKGLYKTGILLIHGLNLAPGSFRDMLPVYQAAGFLIRAVTLPGHGSCPGDLLDVDAEDYIACVKWAMETFRDEVDELYIAGMSTGGGLTLLLASANDPLVKGIILDSPLVEIQSAGARYASYAEKISWLDPRLKWPEVRSQRVPQLYAATSMHAVAEVYKIARKVDEAIKTPFAGTICSVTATDDETVNPFELFSYLFKRNNPKDVHLIYSLQPLEVPKTDALIETVWGRTSDFGADVISYNHIALLTSPSNPLFGRGFRYCGHYAKDDPLRAQCLDPNVPVHFGAITKENLSKYQPLARLYYNPGFSKAVAMVGEYLKRNESVSRGQQAALQKLAEDSGLKQFKVETVRAHLESKAWADLDAAMLAFQKRADLGAVSELDLKAPDGQEHSLANINALKALPSLTKLDLSGNQAISDFSVLKELTSITNLNLAHTGFSDLSLLPENVEVLDISDTVVTDLSGLSRLKKLRKLVLRSAKFSSLKSISSTPWLESVEISNDQMLTDFDALTALVVCKEMTLEAGKQVIAFPMHLIGDMDSLSAFHMRGIPVQGILIAGPNLHTLSLVHANIENLKFLKFADNPAEDDWPSLRVLNLSFNPLAKIDKFKVYSLDALDVSNTLIADKSEIEKLGTMICVDFSETPLAKTGYQLRSSYAANYLYRNLLDEQIKQGHCDFSEISRQMTLSGYSTESHTIVEVGAPIKEMRLAPENFPNWESILIDAQGAFPVLDLSGVGQFKKLRTLSINDATIVGLTLPESLESVVINNCDFSSLSVLENCKNLVSLEILQNPRLAFLTGLEACACLKSLNCESCPVQDFSILSRLKKLTTLHCSANHAESMNSLKDCESLQELFIKTEDVAHLGCPPNLNCLELFSSSVKDFSWLSARKIKQLSVIGSCPSDLSNLLCLDSLQMLSLQGSPDQINPCLLDPSQLGKLSNLNQLSINNCTFENVKELRHLKDLQALSLDGTEICYKPSLLAASIYATPACMAYDLFFWTAELITFRVKSDFGELEIVQQQGEVSVLPKSRPLALYCTTSLTISSDKPVQLRSTFTEGMNKLKEVVLLNVTLKSYLEAEMRKNGINITYR